MSVFLEVGGECLECCEIVVVVGFDYCVYLIFGWDVGFCGVGVVEDENVEVCCY